MRAAPRHRIHTFLATSDIHLKHKLRIDREECVDQVIKAVTFARSLCDDVEFSPEDAGRSDPDFLVQVLGQAIAAGATTLNIPDTVGYTTPEEFGWLIGYLRANTAGAERAGRPVSRATAPRGRSAHTHARGTARARGGGGGLNTHSRRAGGQAAGGAGVGGVVWLSMEGWMLGGVWVCGCMGLAARGSAAVEAGVRTPVLAGVGVGVAL